MNTKCSKKIVPPTIFAAIIVLFAFSAICTPVSAATGSDINDAIDKGMEWLAGQQNADGSWGWDNMIARTGFALVKFETHATLSL